MQPRVVTKLNFQFIHMWIRGWF